MKWAPPQKLNHTIRANHQAIGLRAFIIFVLLLVLIPFFTSLVPKKASAAEQNNNLLLIAEHCHDLDEISTSDYPYCGSWEKLMQNNLGCSNLYVQEEHTDPNDSSVIHKGKWYVKPGAYRDCYDRAKAQYDVLKSKTCERMVRGSENWTNCEEKQNQLYYSIGCDNSMFQDLGNNVWGIKPGALASCEKQLNRILNADIITLGSDGKPSKQSVKDTAPSSDSSSDGSESQISEECDTSTLNPLSWVACAVIDGVNESIKKLNDIINDLASVGNADGSPEPSRIFCSQNTPQDDRTSCQAYEDAWASFRNIALGLLVIVLLVIVISQAMGTEFLDAYTIRKTLPRLIAVTIGITLSWEIMQFLVGLSNALGYGIKFLIEEPFIRAGLDSAQIGGTGSTLLLLLGGGAIAVFTLFGALSFVLTGLIAVLIAVLVLILRQIVIIALAILAPIALIAYILPNTERYYKFWQDTFLRALLMFPMIVAMITVGRVFSAIATHGSTEGLVAQVIGFCAYFAPYFMIPLTFRWSGSIMGAIGNFANNNGLSEGARGALSGYRGRKRQENARKAQNYARFSDRTAVGRRMNDVIGAAANPRDFLNRNPRERIRGARLTGQYNEGAAALENDATYQAHKGDDNFLAALASREFGEKKLNEARQDAANATTAEERQSAEAEIAARTNALALADRVGSRNSASTRLKAFNDVAGTGFQFAPGTAGYEEMSEIADSIVGPGNAQARSSVMNGVQYAARSSGGRPDLGGINHGEKAAVKMGIRKMGNYGRGQGKTDLYHGGAEAWLGSGAVKGNGKTKDIPDMHAGIADSLAKGETSFDSIAEWHDMLLQDKNSATDANKLEIQKQIDAIESLEVSGYGLDSSQHDAFIERLQNNRARLTRGEIPEEERNK